MSSKELLLVNNYSFAVCQSKLVWSQQTQWLMQTNPESRLQQFREINVGVTCGENEIRGSVLLYDLANRQQPRRNEVSLMGLQEEV